MGHRERMLATILASCLMAVAFTPAAAAPSGLSVQLEPQSTDAQKVEEDWAVDVVAGIGADALRAYQMPSQRRSEAMVELLRRSLDWGFVLRNSLPPVLLEGLTDQERNTVAQALLATTAESYAAAFPNYQGERIDILGVRSLGQGVAVVQTKLVIPSNEADLSIGWVVAGLDGSRAGLRDLLVDGASMLASQQSAILALWDEAAQDKSTFLKRIDSPDPWGDG